MFITQFAVFISLPRILWEGSKWWCIHRVNITTNRNTVGLSWAYFHTVTTCRLFSTLDAGICTVKWGNIGMDGEVKCIDRTNVGYYNLGNRAVQCISVTGIAKLYWTRLILLQISTEPVQILMCVRKMLLNILEA